MSHFSFLFALASLAIMACMTSHASETNAPNIRIAPPEGYTLVWSDEFDTEGLPNPEKWSYDTYRNKDGWWNEEEQYYSDSRAENARIEKGHLIIEAHKDGGQLRDYSEYAEQLRGYADYGGQKYSSARLSTKGKAAWQYGYFEIRAKVPCGRGLWPAIWALPEKSDQWRESGEIDIMEYVGHDPNRFHATLHIGGNTQVRKTELGEKIEVKTACNAFHTHSLLWTPDGMTVSLDGSPYFHHEKGEESEEAWPFNRPYHLIMNLAVGGNWAGTEGISKKAFPAQMEVDYVRVYQWRPL